MLAQILFKFKKALNFYIFGEDTKLKAFIFFLISNMFHCYKYDSNQKFGKRKKRQIFKFCKTTKL